MTGVVRALLGRAVAAPAGRARRDEYGRVRRELAVALAASVAGTLVGVALDARVPLVVLGVVPWLLVVALQAGALHRHYALGWRLLVASAVAAFAVAGVAVSPSLPLRLAAGLAGFATVVAVLYAMVHALERTANRWLARAFPDAPTALLVRLTHRLRRVRFRGSEVVVAEGDPSDAFYVVTGGEAEVACRAGDSEVYLRTLIAGDFFGEVGLLQATTRTATVRAVRGLEVIALDHAGFAAAVAGSELTAMQLRRVLRVRGTRPEMREDAVPLPAWSRLLKRMFKHPRAMHYNRLVGGVLAANVLLAVAGWSWWSSTGRALAALGLLAQANVALAVLFRQQAVINALGRLATRAPPTWPLRIRWLLAKYYHHGGLHVGTALAGTLWYVAFVAVLIADGDAPVAAAAAAVLVVVLLLVIALLAMPPLRARMHDRFEVSHRFCGWAALALVWISTVLLEPDLRAVATAPAVWLLVAATLGVAWPWLRLRRVLISVERPSDHVAVVTLVGEPTPDMGTTRGISRHPLVGWHQFANVPALPGGAGHRMVVSRAGDWTAAFIAGPPSHVWIRGVPTIELANVRRLFRKVVFVTTGSGIGPALGHLLDREASSRLVWATRSPRATYGDALVDEILAAQPDATIWNTDERGKPDILRLAYGAYVASAAEAAICISNRAVTWEVVYGLERRGIPAFGPIFDS